MLKKRFFGMLTLFIGVILTFCMVACDLGERNDNRNGGNGGNGGGAGTTRDNAILVTAGNSSSHTISQNGKNWFKFVGTGDTFIFETRGNVVDTYMGIESGGWFYDATDDNSGEGYNALCSLNTISGTTYYIEISTRNSTSGTYTFVITASTVNIRTNPISISIGNISSHTISSGGQHWFNFQGTGNNVILETSGNVVTASIELYIGDNTSTFLTNNTRISFPTISGTTYYFKITGNSGTYTINLSNGSGDGSSRYYSIPVTIGYSSSHTISQTGKHWFSFLGTGNTVIFETTGNVVDTYMGIESGGWFYDATDDNSGEGYNALCSLTTTLGTTYFIEITTRSNTSGTYTFIVRNP